MRGRNSVKGPPQSPVFEGVYNNTRMLHFLTAVVGSTCDVRVRNGTVYEGIFKTLSSKLELAVDTVHRKTSDTAGGPKSEDIIDTMIFKPSDVVVVQFKDVDLNYATKEKKNLTSASHKLTESAVSSKVNGEHREKVLQRWEGGDSNSDDFDLESDVSNGWDANEMFRFNEETYGVKTTYDSSLSLYTTPLEKDNSAEFRQREARASQLAKEIEASPQYRVRISMENDDGRTEEERFSAVQRPTTTDRESPGINCRDSKYIPLPQRSRDGTPRGGGLRTNVTRGGRMGSGSLPPRGGLHHPESSSSPSPDQRVINGGPSRMSPKAQRPTRGGKPMMGRGGSVSDVSPHSPATGANRTYHPRSPKSGGAAPAPGGQDISSALAPGPTSPPEARQPPPPPPPAPSAAVDSSGSSSSPGSSSPKPATAAPPFGADVKDLGSTTGKDPTRPADLPSAGSLEFSKAAGKGLLQSPSDHKRNQIEELKKFGEDFRLQSPGQELGSAASRFKDGGVDKAKEPPEEKGCGPESADSAAEALPTAQAKAVSPGGEGREEKKPHEPGEGPLPPSSPQGKSESGEEEKEGVSEQVKKSTLNPNAKEFNPTKTLVPVAKPASTPTPPRPQTQPSPSIMVTPGQNAIYNTQYISYVHGIHMNPAMQGPQVYQYTIPPVQVSQSKQFRSTKGSVPPQRSEQHHPPSAPPIMQAASAAGPPLVAGPYSPPYLPYSPQQFAGQPAMMQAMAQYHSQPVYASMIQSNPRMMGSAGHPQAIVSSSGPQYPSVDQAPPQAMYVSAGVPQPYPHATPLHHHTPHPQPATTPTGSQQQGQHAAPSPVQHQQHQTGQPPHMSSAQAQQNLYHAALTPTPPSITPGPNPQSPQASFPQQAVYAIHPHQQLQHGYSSMAHVTQAHVQSGMAGPHHHPGASHPAQVMLLSAPQSHGHGGPPQQGVAHSQVPTMSASAATHYTYIGHHQMPVQPHQQQLFHPQGN